MLLVWNFVVMRTNDILQSFEKHPNRRVVVFIVALLFCFTPLVSPALALLLGILIAQFVGHPYLHLNHRVTHSLLQMSVVGLGFGMNAQEAWNAGKEGLMFTVFSILITLIFGFFLGKMLKVNVKTSYLISAGTAICGGSAIAAIAPVIKAKEKQISIALGTIFILNSLALFIFPFLGSFLDLSQSQFGIWSAIAIQDTSSVVGAASKYGEEALQIATTVKLTRALWIIPIALLSSWLFKSKGTKISIPYFIGLFVVAVLLNSYVPFVGMVSRYVVYISKIGLALTLFLIGSGLSKELLLSVGLKPIVQGTVLWLIISVIGLCAVLMLL